ncbi:MAG: hypothetical protein HGA27_05290, partial [Peptococcaceae bacterium]|nr:hypothetical protein [Peptococcaceae bacterium]
MIRSSKEIRLTTQEREVKNIFLSAVLLFLAVLIILIVYGIKNQSMESGEKDVKSIYLYLVLFATLMMIIGGSVSAFMAIADIVYPAPYYQSYQEFISMD